MKADWVVIDATPPQTKMRCKRCGTEQVIAFPMAVDVFLAMTKTFIKLHKNCKEGENDSTR